MNTIELNGDERDFYSWLAGFLDGEGSFNLMLGARHNYSARAQVSLRCDDWRVVQMIWEQTGLGSAVTRPARSTSQAGVTWWVLRALECQALARRLRAVGGLRAKKARDFAIWSEAVDLLCEGGGSEFGPNADRLGELKAALHKVKEFDPAFAEGYQSLVGVTGNGTAWSGGQRLMHYHKLTDEMAAEIVRLRDEGQLTQKEIARRFGIGEMAVSRLVRGQYARVAGSAKAQSERLTLEQIDALVARFRAGEMARTLCEEYGVSKPQFYRYVNGEYDRRWHRSET